MAKRKGYIKHTSVGSRRLPALLRIIGEKKRAVDVDSRSALRDREKSELVDFRCVAYLKSNISTLLHDIISKHIENSLVRYGPNEDVVAAKTYY